MLKTRDDDWRTRMSLRLRRLQSVACSALPPLSVTIRFRPRDVTLVAELRDSVSGAILVRAADREKGRVSGELKVHSEMSGSAEAEQLFGEWARLLHRALEAARETP